MKATDVGVVLFLLLAVREAESDGSPSMVKEELRRALTRALRNMFPAPKKR